jgi:hypothetical protein
MDIVERLRREEDRLDDEAADEIERLRKALKEVSGYVARAEWFYMTEETKAVVERVFGEVKSSKWKCPMGYASCKESCGNYGCGN